MNIAVIIAGGVGSRMNSKALPKQFLEVQGKPIIIHTLEVFQSSSEIDIIIVACLGEWINNLNLLVEKYRITKVKAIVEGGNTGQESIYNGLKASSNFDNSDRSIVLIHDAVRPLINTKVISDNISSVIKNGSAITCSPVTETIALIGVKPDPVVLERDKLRLARGPQSFYLKDILEVHNLAVRDGIEDSIDSSTLMTTYKRNVVLVEGPVENIKITTPNDFYLFKALLEAKENSQLYGY